MIKSNMERNKLKLARIFEDPEELFRLYSAKINQIKMIRKRGFFIPKNERKMLREDFDLDAFKKYCSSTDKLLDNCYFRFLTKEEEQNLQDSIRFPQQRLFQFEEYNRDYDKVSPVSSLMVMADQDQQKTTKSKTTDFGHVKISTNGIFARRDVYEKYRNKIMIFSMVRYPQPKIEKKSGKIVPANKATITDINNQIPYFQQGQHLYILRDPLTGPGRIALKEFRNLQVFVYDELIINIVDHFLVPKHQLLSEKEAIDIKKIFGVENMSSIGHNDPITKYFAAAQGDIFYILRRELIPFSAVTKKEHYRVVVYEPKT